MRVLGIWAILVCFASAARADLVIDLEEIAGDGVRLALSGSGTIDTGGGANPGATLDFLNFSGTPFKTAIPTTSSDFSLSASSLTLLLNGSTPSDVMLFRTQRSVTAGGSDIDLIVSQGISNGDGFAASGSAIIDGLLFSQLIPGTYLSSAGDSSDFGNVTLTIRAASAVPEPQSLVLVMLAGLGLLTRRPKRN